MVLRNPPDNWGEIIPRRWQAECLPKLITHFQAERPLNGIVRAIMGSGKAKAIAQLCASCEMSAGEVIVVSTSSIYLVKGLVETIRSRVDGEGFFGRSKVGSYYTYGKDINTPIIVTCLPSLPELSEKLAVHRKKVVMWQIDECCAAGTKILMSNGLDVDIEKVKIGDEVCGYSCGKIKKSRVIHTFKNKYDGEMIYIGGRLCVTPNHPICVNGPIGLKYKNASDLSELDTVHGISADYLVEKEVQTFSIPAHCDVFNLETETGNYFAEDILVHNCHRSEQVQVKSSHEILMPERVIGWTATPFRSDEKQSLTLFDKLLYDFGPAEAIRDGVVVPWRIEGWSGGETTLDVATYELIKDSEGPGVVNAFTIEDAVGYAGYLNDRNFPAAAVHSKMTPDDIDNVLADLKNGIIRAVVHCSLLQEGVDLPFLRWIALRRTVSSRTRFIQEIGRVLRVDPDNHKTEAVIYDPNDLMSVFRLTYPEVLGGDAAAFEDGERDEGKILERQLTQEVFELMREATDAKAHKSAMSVQPLASYLSQLVSIFDVHGLIERKISSRDWRNQAISDKQLRALVNMKWSTQLKKVPAIHQKALGILTESGRSLNKGMGSDLITIQMSLAEKRQWPDFKNLDRSATDGINKHEKRPTPTKAPAGMVKAKDAPKLEQGLLFQNKRNPQ